MKTVSLEDLIVNRHSARRLESGIALDDDTIFKLSERLLYPLFDHPATFILACFNAFGVQVCEIPEQVSIHKLWISYSGPFTPLKLTAWELDFPSAGRLSRTIVGRLWATPNDGGPGVTFSFQFRVAQRSDGSQSSQFKSCITLSFEVGALA